MKTGWRVILIVVTFAIFLGAVGIGVGFMTGGSIERITPAVDEVVIQKVGFGLEDLPAVYEMLMGELASIFQTV